MKKVRLWQCLLLFACLAAAVYSCAAEEAPPEEEREPPLGREDAVFLAQLAYDRHPELGYTVYIEEDGAYQPFLVLTDDYNGSGNTLLLRKNLLPERRRYNQWELWTASYYNGSEIDLWLNGDYKSLLQGVDPVASTINISAKEALSVVGEETEDIVRDVFLLSWGEVGGQLDLHIVPPSGVPLDFFSGGIESRIACRKVGVADSWFLRSVNTWYYDEAMAIAPDGIFGEATVTNDLGIRPAFCVDAKTEIALRDVPGAGEVFVIGP